MKTASSKRQLQLETPVMVFFYRLFPRWFGNAHFLLLTTIGRKSQRQRTVAVVYMPIDDRYMVMAANVGLDSQPGWYLNLKQQPQVQIQIGTRKLSVQAEELSGAERDQCWADWVKTNPGYAGFQAKTSRQFPMVMFRVAH
jgi:deazaflavin-dependent oxidoreductase (nitroreductase family)